MNRRRSVVKVWGSLHIVAQGFTLPEIQSLVILPFQIVVGCMIIPAGKEQAGGLFYLDFPSPILSLVKKQALNYVTQGLQSLSYFPSIWKLLLGKHVNLNTKT